MLSPVFHFTMPQYFSPRVMHTLLFGEKVLHKRKKPMEYIMRVSHEAL